MDVIGGKGKKVVYENKLFNFDLIIQEKDRKTAGDGKKIRVKKQKEIKILWKKYESGKIVGQPIADSEVIQFEKDGKKCDIEVKELILNKGLFSDKITHIAFTPDLRIIPYSVPYSDYPPYHVYNLNPVELKNGVRLVKPLKTGRLVGVGVLAVIVLGFLTFCLVKFLKRKKKS